MKISQFKTPQYIKCPCCSESIETRKICSLCDARLQSLVNLHPEIFQETVFDRLNPKLEEILLEIKFLKNILKDFKIKGLTLAVKKSLKSL